MKRLVFFFSLSLGASGIFWFFGLAFVFICFFARDIPSMRLTLALMLFYLYESIYTLSSNTHIESRDRLDRRHGWSSRAPCMVK